MLPCGDRRGFPGLAFPGTRCSDSRIQSAILEMENHGSESCARSFVTARPESPSVTGRRPIL